MNGISFSLRGRSVLFWDFDGVIKDSVAVKSDAFHRLFLRFGAAVAARVREHHERNGGLSRYAKLPIYLDWAGQANDAAAVARYDVLFSAEVKQAVVDSPWVAGAREYLEANHATQRCVLVTATPQGEIEDIVGALGIAHLFREIHGAPEPKAEAMRSVLARWQVSAAAALMIGDSDADCAAAAECGVPFLLRRTPLNAALSARHPGMQCEDFSDG